jgi:ankyrin repeat protein
LHQYGVNLDDSDRFGNRPLMRAAQTGNIPLAEFLLENGADPNAIANNGETPLILAVENDCQEMVVFLLDNNADPDLKTEKFGSETALIAAIGSNGWKALKIAELLLEKGANPDVLDPNFGKTALMHAVNAGKTKMVKAILTTAKSIDVNAAGTNGDTALTVALTDLIKTKPSKANEIVKLLLEAGADVESTSQRDKQTGWTPLMLAAWNGRNLHVQPADLAQVVEIVEALLAAGANPNAVEPEQGRTVLILAASMHHTPIVGALLKAGADVTAEANNGDTAVNSSRSLNGPSAMTALLRDAQVRAEQQVQAQSLGYLGR